MSLASRWHLILLIGMSGCGHGSSPEVQNQPTRWEVQEPIEVNLRELPKARWQAAPEPQEYPFGEVYEDEPSGGVYWSIGYIYLELGGTSTRCGRTCGQDNTQPRETDCDGTGIEPWRFLREFNSRRAHTVEIRLGTGAEIFHLSVPERDRTTVEATYKAEGTSIDFHYSPSVDDTALKVSIKSTTPPTSQSIQEELLQIMFPMRVKVQNELGWAAELVVKPEQIVYERRGSRINGGGLQSRERVFWDVPGLKSQIFGSCWNIIEAPVPFRPPGQ